MDMEILRPTCMKDTLCLGALSSLEKDMCYVLRIIQTIWVVYNKFQSCKRVKELISPENQLTVFRWFEIDYDGE